MNYNIKVTEYIDNAPTAHKANLEIIRKLIHESVLGVTEEIKWGFPVFAKTKDFTYIRVAKNHITFGFYNFDKIQDTENILEGNGNTLRHIKIRVAEDINEGLFKEWLRVIAI
jgi:hypothetical protein